MNRISSLIKVLGLVRNKVHQELPLQQLVLFLTVVERPGITMPELVELLAMPQGTVSRNVKALSYYIVWQEGVAVPHGRNLLRTHPNEKNRHALAVFPTGRGEALAEEIAFGLQAEAGTDLVEKCGQVDRDEVDWRSRYLSRQAVRDY